MTHFFMGRGQTRELDTYIGIYGRLHTDFCDINGCQLEITRGKCISEFLSLRYTIYTTYGISISEFQLATTFVVVVVVLIYSS